MRLHPCFRWPLLAFHFDALKCQACSFSESIWTSLSQLESGASSRPWRFGRDQRSEQMVSQPRSRQVSGSRGCGPLRLHVRDAVGPSSSNLVLVDATSHEASELGTVHAQPMYKISLQENWMNCARRFIRASAGQTG